MKTYHPRFNPRAYGRCGRRFRSRFAAQTTSAHTNAANGVESTEDARDMGDASHEQVHDAWSEYEEANERAVRADDRATRVGARWQCHFPRLACPRLLSAALSGLQFVALPTL